MGLSSLNHLYRQVILDHAQHPRHQHRLAEFSTQIELLNPTCGDALLLQVNIVDDVIQNVGFQGDGCSISMASASMMCDALLGKTIEEASHLITTFNHLIGGQSPIIQFDKGELSENIVAHYLDLLEDAALLEGVKQFPARYKCAILAWRAMAMSLDGCHDTQLDGLHIKH